MEEEIWTITPLSDKLDQPKKTRWWLIAYLLAIAIMTAVIGYEWAYLIDNLK